MKNNILLILSLIFLGSTYATQIQNLTGKFCGEYYGIVNNITMEFKATDFNINATVLGNPKGCEQEEYKLFQNGTIQITNLENKNDCLNKVLSSEGLPPKDLDILYKTPDIFIEIYGVKVTIHPC